MKSYKICKKKASANYNRKKMNKKGNQVFNLLLIEQIFLKKQQNKKKNEKGAYGLSPN